MLIFTFAHILRFKHLLCLFAGMFFFHPLSTVCSQMHVFACDNFTILALYFVVCCFFSVLVCLFCMFAFLSLRTICLFCLFFLLLLLPACLSVCLLMQILTILLLNSCVCRFLNRTRPFRSLHTTYIHIHTHHSYYLSCTLHTF